MADVVSSKFMILYAKLGSVFYPIACAKDSSIRFTSETIELAPRLSTDFREYEYGRKTGKITGTGLTKIDTAPANLYTVFDLIGFQLNSQKLLVKYSVQDPQGNLKVFEVNTIITDSGLTKTSGQSGAYDFELTTTGKPLLSSTPVQNTNPQILVYEYTATGGEVSLTLPFSDSATILLVEYGPTGAIPVNIFPEGYGPGEVQYNPVTKLMLFGDIMTAGLYIRILYVDVNSTVPSNARSTGDGGYRTVDGTTYRTTG